jgi:hypothetical protein
MKALLAEYVFHMLNPDGNEGGGYGTTMSKIDGPSKPKLAQGHQDWPYGWEEESTWEEDGNFDYEPSDFGFDDAGDIDRFSNKIGNAHIAADPAGRYDYDRKSFVDGETIESVKLLLRVIEEDVYRLRSASSVPDSIGSDAWPGATPPKFPVRPERREPRYTFKSVMLGDEEQWDSYEGEGDPEDPEALFGFQEASYE